MIEQINLYMYFKFKLYNERIQETFNKDLIYIFDLNDKVLEINKIHLKGYTVKLFKDYLALYVNDLSVASMRYSNINKIDVK